MNPVHSVESFLKMSHDHVKVLYAFLYIGTYYALNCYSFGLFFEEFDSDGFCIESTRVSI